MTDALKGSLYKGWMVYSTTRRKAELLEGDEMPFEDEVREFKRILSWYNTDIGDAGRLGMTTSHSLAEDVCARLLNALYGWALQNANKPGVNEEAVDLIGTDEHGDPIVVQVTATCDSDKINQTLRKEKTKEYQQQGCRLKFAFVGKQDDANKVQSEKTGWTLHNTHGIAFDRRSDTLFTADLVSKFRQLDPSKREEILKLVRADIGMVTTNAPAYINEDYVYGFDLESEYDIVGRQADVDHILRALQNGKTVLVHGEGGIGKTEVCREVIRQSKRSTVVAISLAETKTYASLLSQFQLALHLQEAGDERTAKESILRALAKLPQNDLLIYLDNFEDTLSNDVPKSDRDSTRRLLREIRSKTSGMFLISSRIMLRETNKLHNYPLDILDPEDATLLFCNIWSLSHQRVASEEERAPIAQFVEEELYRFPLSIVLTASQDCMSFRDLCERWKEASGTIRLEDADNPRHRSLVQALVMSYNEVKDSNTCRLIWTLFTMLPSSASQEFMHDVLSTEIGDSSLFELQDCLQRMRKLSLIRMDSARLKDGHGESITWDMLQTLRRSLPSLPQSDEDRLAIEEDEVTIVNLLYNYYQSLFPQDRTLYLDGSTQSEHVLECIDDILFFMDRLIKTKADDSISRIEDLHFRVGNFYQQRPYEALEILRQLSKYKFVSERFQASVLEYLGDLGMRTADLDGAGRSYGEAERIYRDIHADLGLANVLQAMGDLLQEKAKYPQAIETYNYAVQLYQKVQDIMGLGYTISELSYCYASEFKESGDDGVRTMAFRTIDTATSIMQRIPYKSVRDYIEWKTDVARHLLDT